MYKEKFMIINSQAFGDFLLGTHLARLLKDTYPDCFVGFFIPDSSNLTTSTDGGHNEMLEIIRLQEGIDRAAVVKRGCMKQACRAEPYNNQISNVFRQNEWYSDLGIVKSMLSDYIVMGHTNINTETQFNVGQPKDERNFLRIATAGTYDWAIKLGRVPDLSFIDKDIELVELGRDTRPGQTYLESLRELNNCDLYLGPAGSMGHAAVGLGLDTIIVSSTLPPEYDMPEFYHSGWHKTIKCRAEHHCGDYKCIVPKYFDPANSQSGWGNPKTTLDFWTKKCHFMETGISCVASIADYQLEDTYYSWMMKLNNPGLYNENK